MRRAYTPSAVTRMAVLPFRDISKNPTAPYLAEELTDQLISTLGRISALQVASLTSVLQFRDRPASMAEIGKALRVDESSKRRSSSSRAPKGVQIGAYQCAVGRRRHRRANLDAGIRAADWPDRSVAGRTSPARLPPGSAP